MRVLFIIAATTLAIAAQASPPEQQGVLLAGDEYQIVFLDSGLELTGWDPTYSGTGGYIWPASGEFIAIDNYADWLCAVQLGGQISCFKGHDIGSSLRPTRREVMFAPTPAVDVAVGDGFIAYLDNLGEFRYRHLGGGWGRATNSTNYFDVAAGKYYACGVRLDVSTYVDCEYVPGFGAQDWTVNTPHQVVDIAVSDLTLYILNSGGSVDTFDLVDGIWTYDFYASDVVEIAARGNSVCAIRQNPDSIECQGLASGIAVGLFQGVTVSTDEFGNDVGVADRVIGHDPILF